MEGEYQFYKNWLYAVNMIKKLYIKYKEIINYLIAGFLTLIVSISSYALLTKILHIHYIISNIVSWIIAVLFAYYINIVEICIIYNLWKKVFINNYLCLVNHHKRTI